jgi:DNA polymerase-3 subunit beta
VKLSVSRAALASALKTCAHVIGSAPTMPVLANARMTVVRGKILRCVATDLTVSLTIDVPCEGTTGDVLVPAAATAKALESLSGLEVSIALDGTSSLVLRSGKSKQIVPCEPGRDYPKIPTAEGTWQTVPTSVLESVIGGCQAAICQDETRFHLAGIHMWATAGELVGQATDGHRGHAVRRSCDAEIPRGIVPERGSDLILELLKGNETIELACEANYRHVRAGSALVSVKVIDAKFPPFEQVVPSHTHGVTVGRADLLTALRRTRLATDENNGVTLTVDESGLTLSSQLKVKGFAAEDRIEAETDLRIVASVNPRYLAEAATATTADRVTLWFGKPLDPVVVTNEGEMLAPTSGSGALIMPMRVQ